MTSEWSPSEQDIRSGQQAYMHYVGGVGILNFPDSDFAKGMLGEGITVQDDPLTVVTCAEELMFSGLNRLIRVANEPQLRSDKAKMESRFERALPHMQSIVSSIYDNDSHAMRLDRINPALVAMRPMPLAERVIYRYFCHGRRAKLETITLMDGFRPATILEDILEGRTLGNSGASHHKRHYINQTN